MEEQIYWFETQGENKRPTAIHWKGKAVEIAPVILSAVWVAASVARFIPSMNIGNALPFFSFSMFSFAQGVKYFFYHEKTKK